MIKDVIALLHKTNFATPLCLIAKGKNQLNIKTQIKILKCLLKNK